MKLVNKCLTRQQPTNIVVPLSHVPIICFGFSTTACIFYTGACISSAACILSSAYCKTQNSERQIWYDLQRKIEKKIESFSDPDCWNFCLLWLSCHEESNYGSLLAIQQLAINSTPHLLSAHKRLIAIHWYPFVLGYLSGVRRVRCTEGRFVLFGFMFIRTTAKCSSVQQLNVHYMEVSAIGSGGSTVYNEFTLIFWSCSPSHWCAQCSYRGV